jgi:hypothetical protein
VTFSNGAKGKIASNSTATQLFITNLTGLAAGNLMATVTVEGFSSIVEQVATVLPYVKPSTIALSPKTKTLVIHGLGFYGPASKSSVAFSNGATGTVSRVTATTLIITDLMGLTPGPLEITSVTSNGVSNATTVQVAMVVAL